MCVVVDVVDGGVEEEEEEEEEGDGRCAADCRCSSLERVKSYSGRGDNISVKL